MNAQKDLALRALENMRGDDLYRAKAAFQGLSDKQMQEPHGQSGETRQQVLDGYAEHEKRVNAAIEWVKAAT